MKRLALALLILTVVVSCEDQSISPYSLGCFVGVRADDGEWDLVGCGSEGQMEDIALSPNQVFTDTLFLPVDDCLECGRKVTR